MTCIRISFGRSKICQRAHTHRRPSRNFWGRSRLRYATLSSAYTVRFNTQQIDRLNLEGYANLEYWVAELDQKIESILLQRLTHIIQVWCAEFDRIDEDGGRREPLASRNTTAKRTGDKRQKDDKVCVIVLRCRIFNLSVSLACSWEYDVKAYHSRNSHTEPSHFLGPSD